MIAEQMHRLASRLGIRDGEAYTICSGLVVALVLAAVGLPGVIRGFDAPATAQVAAPAGSRSTEIETSGEQVSEPAASAPSLPAIAAPTESRTPAGPSTADPSGSSPGAPGSPAAVPPAGSRTPGDWARFAEIARPAAPGALAVAPDGIVYVATDQAGPGPSVLVAFSATGVPIGSWAAPGQPVDRSRGLTGVAVDHGGTVWVTDAATGRVLRLDQASDALAPAAEARDLPACGLLSLRSPCESGLVDSAPLLSGVAVAADGTVVVADRAQGVLWVVDGTELTPLATIEDRLPGDGPLAVSFAGDDELLLAVGARGSSFPPGLPALLRLRLQDGEASGAPTVITDLAAGETPSDLVAGASGRVYVAIPSTGTIADIGVDQGDRIDIDGDGAEPALEAPTGLALRTRSLLVSDTSGRVFDLAVDDRPVTRGPT